MAAMWDLLTALTIYATTYASHTRTMAESDCAWEWMQTMSDPGWKFATHEQLEAHAKQSAEWASWGYGPAQAAPHIAAGRDPIRAAQHDATAAGLRPPRPAEIRQVDPAVRAAMRAASPFYSQRG